MRISFSSWTEVILAQPYQRVAWFVFECIEREHRLNLDALSAYWLRALVAWLKPLSLRSSGLPAKRTEQAAASLLLASHQQRPHPSSRAQ